MDEILERVVELAEQHRETWAGESEMFWLGGLMGEVSELALALAWRHEHPPEFELVQIASIAINWLRHRGVLEEVGE